MMSGLRIVLGSILVAVLYGVAHDLVTARVCVEYFTIGHPRVVDSESPTVLALVWGVLATWWVGAGLGALLALAARAGQRPKVKPGALVRPVLRLLALMGLCALVAGLAGFGAARAGWVHLLEPLAARVPAERHVVFLADMWAHSASYGVGFVGGIFFAWRTWRSRGSRGASSERDGKQHA